MMKGLEIARLDESGVLIGVEPCTEADHKTDPVARSVRLDGDHDVRNMIGLYRWDYNANTFLSLSTNPLDVASRDNAELVEGIVDAIEGIMQALNTIAETTNNIATTVETDPPVAMRFVTDDSQDDIARPLREPKPKIKKLGKFRLCERSSRTIKQFRRHLPKRKADIPSTSTEVVYEIIPRDVDPLK